jgi:hypothetical protein
MENFLNPDKIDLIREALIVIIGVLIRYFEKKKIKKVENEY